METILQELKDLTHTVTAELVEPLRAQAKPASLIADYPTVELAGSSRLILSLGQCGRMFGVDLPEDAGPLTARAELNVPSLDETGCPQGATFRRFLLD